MVAFPTPSPLFHVDDPDDGAPLAGGLVYTYAQGTTTPKDTWADKDKAGTNANPVELDANGDAPIFLDGIYKFIVKRADDSLVYELDGIASATLVPDDYVTNAKLADMAEATFKMRAAGAGTGDPIDGTAAEAKTALALVKADVGLGNVDNTSDATKNSAAATLTNKTLVDPIITGTPLEDIHTITDEAAFEIDPGNGSIQQITLGADRTPAATNFLNGEGILLMVNDGAARTITWTTVGVVWIGGSAPTLATSGWTHIVLYKVGGTIYGKHVGDSA